MRIRIDGQIRTVEGQQSVVLGRSPEADIVVINPYVSRRHAVLQQGPDNHWAIEDLGSSGGLHHQGSRVARVAIDGSTEVWLGRPLHGQLVEVDLAQPASAIVLGELRSVTSARPRIRLGRSAENDIVVDDVLVSRRHAEIRWSPDGGVEVVDLDSHNGTFVNGVRVARAGVSSNDLVSVGRHTFRMVAGALEEYVESGGVSLAAQALTVRTRSGALILDDVSFEVAPGSLVAVVGPTGCGKSTLLKAIVGETAASGQVFYDSRELFASFDELRARIGYVPQDDILHGELRLNDALRYAAQLRLPADTSAAERDSRVAEIMAQLGLSERAHVRIADVSGGQRKRTNVAIELLVRPSVLLLDEPTSGLDPGFEKSVMELLRRLADEGTTVVVVTHNLQHLELCDAVIALQAGGTVAFTGDPASLLDHFHCADYASMFRQLQHGDVRRSAQPRRARVTVRPTIETSSTGAPRMQSRWGQLRTLVRRQIALFAADRRNLVFAALSVLVPAVVLLLLVPPGALDRDSGPHPDGFLLVAALVVAGATIGAGNTLREVVKEQAIHRRERAAGLSVTAYLGSKLTVVGGITVVQSAVLVRVATLSAGGPDTAGLPVAPLLELTMVVAATAVAAAALGLLLSALVTSSEKAMALVAVVFMVMWLFSGAAISLQDKPALRAASHLVSSNWGFSAAKAGTDLTSLSGRCGEADWLSLLGVANQGCTERGGAATLAVAVDLAALLTLTMTTMFAAGAVLLRRGRVPTSTRR